MAAGKEAVSFDDIIQADRLRRKNEALAKEIFGKGRKSNTPASNGNRKPGAGPSLASRVGVAKASQRSLSSTPKPKADIESSWGHDLHEINNPQVSRTPRIARENPRTRLMRKDLLLDAVVTRTPNEGIGSPVNLRGVGNGISIRGLAGPYVVVGSNFAPGTTAADIESAMMSTGGEMQGCRVITSSPTVIAEMVFTEKVGADNVVAMFNNKKADGRILHVYMKQGPPQPSTPAPEPVRQTPTEPKAARPDNNPFSLYDSQREQSDRNRRRADPEFQDGSYGFETKEDRMDVDTITQRDSWRGDRTEAGRGRDNGRGRDDRGLYSDDLYPRPRVRSFR
ncbi:hypothetical protein MMC12_001861 [Toensbergia leucococca]|nr:hypothetical protein [Toensbergia leucococca]